MYELTAQGLLVAGVLLQTAALFPIRQLMARLPPGAVRRRWNIMSLLILVFVAGYLAYALAFWHRHQRPVELIVPTIFFLGACFVWLSARLSLRTALDVLRMRVLEHEALIDPLTGVLNRRSLDGRLSEEVRRAGRYGSPLSILMLDIDHFKRINDGHGHPAGDRVLVEMATLVARELRESDVLTRYGGEEFLVLTPNTPPEGAIQIAERIRQRVAAYDFGLGSTLTLSIGVASLGDGIDSAEQLIGSADARLYQAKHAGRDRVVPAAAMPAGARGVVRSTPV